MLLHIQLTIQTLQTQNIDKDEEQMNSHKVGGNVNLYNHFKNKFQGFL